MPVDAGYRRAKNIWAWVPWKMLFQQARQSDPAKNIFAGVGAFTQADPAGIGVAKLKRQIDADLKGLRGFGRERVGETAHCRCFGFDIGCVLFPEPKLGRDCHVGN